VKALGERASFETKESGSARFPKVIAPVGQAWAHAGNFLSSSSNISLSSSFAFSFNFLILW